MIKVGVIGCGYWGKNHVRVLSGLPCRLVGVADKDETKKSLADQYTIAFYTNYRKLLKKIDAVVIVTPPETHYSIARQALARGVHVFVEKPFVQKVFQAERLIELADQEKRMLMVGHIFMYNAAFRFIKQKVEEGDLGDIYYLYSRRVNFGVLRSDVNALQNFAPHDLSIITALLGNPMTIRAIGKDLIQEGIEDIVFIHMEFKNGLTAHIHLSWLDPQKQRELVIVGSKKMLRWDDTDTNQPLTIQDKSFTVPERWRAAKTWKTYPEFTVKTRVGETSHPDIMTQEPLKVELQYFLDCIRDGKKPLTDGNQGLRITKLIDLAQQSLKSGGKAVKVE